MAIFHLDFKIVKRSEGMTSVAKAAYHARTRITDVRIGETYDFSHRTDLHGEPPRESWRLNFLRKR